MFGPRVRCGSLATSSGQVVRAGIAATRTW